MILLLATAASPAAAVESVYCGHHGVEAAALVEPVPACGSLELYESGARHSANHNYCTSYTLCSIMPSTFTVSLLRERVGTDRNQSTQTSDASRTLNEYNMDKLARID